MTLITGKTAYVYRIQYAPGRATNSNVMYGLPLSWDEVNPYYYDSDGSVHRFRHSVVHLYGNDGSGAAYDWQTVDLWQTVYGGQDASPPPSYQNGGGDPDWYVNENRVVSIGGGAGQFTATVNVSGVDPNTGIQCSKTVTITMTAEMTMNAAIAMAQSLYAACPALTPTSGGFCNYSSLGSPVWAPGWTAPGQNTWGHAGFYGMTGTNDGSDGPEVVAVTGVIYMVQAPVWFIETQTFDANNNVTSVRTAQQSRHVGYFVLEDLTVWSEATVGLGIGPANSGGPTPSQAGQGMSTSDSGASTDGSPLSTE
jgi:hypothetical protein